MTIVLFVIILVGVVGLLFAYFAFGPTRGGIDKHPSDGRVEAPGAEEDSDVSIKDRDEIQTLSERGNE